MACAPCAARRAALAARQAAASPPTPPGPLVDVDDAIRKAKGRAAIANIRALYPHLNRDTAGASK